MAKQEIKSLSPKRPIMVSPAKRQKYTVCLEKKMLGVSLGNKPNAPRVHLSKEMIQWLATEGIKLWDDLTLDHRTKK